MPVSWKEHRGSSPPERAFVSCGSGGLSRNAWSVACCREPLRVCPSLSLQGFDAGTQLPFVSHPGWHVGFLLSQKKVHWREGSGWRQTVGCSAWGPSIPIQGQLELMPALQPNVIKHLLLPDDVLFSEELAGLLWIQDAAVTLSDGSWEAGEEGEKRRFTALANQLANRSRFLKNSCNCLQGRKSTMRWWPAHTQSGRICDPVSPWSSMCHQISRKKPWAIPPLLCV